MQENKFYPVVYGYRIEVYTVGMEHIISLELKDGKHGTYSNKNTMRI